jgi:sensor histidine kinase YesM
VNALGRLVGWTPAGSNASAPRAGWLRGITPGRLAIVVLVSCVFALRQDPELFLPPLSAHLTGDLLQAAVYFVASLPMLLLVVAAERRSRRATPARRAMTLSIATVAGALAYASLIALDVLKESDAPVGSVLWLILSVSYFLRALLMGGLLTAALYFIDRENDAAQALQASSFNRIALDRQMAEARLRVLQAQIEPHFLFNTLAHVRRLYRTDAPGAQAMLRNLAAYLREALPQMREQTSTIGRELGLARAYLGIVQARMGDRLAVVIDVPDDLLCAEFPPMILSTLVENAIKHGISPRPQGGTVKIDARRDGARVRVGVADDGVGFSVQEGSGIGLSNTRARLEALYGDRGTLRFAANPLRGVTATVELPWRTLAAAATPT